MRSAEARGGYEEARRAFQVGELVRQARTEAGLTQSALAERLGTIQSRVRSVS